MGKQFIDPEIDLLRLEMIDVIATSPDLDYIPEEDELPFVPAN